MNWKPIKTTLYNLILLCVCMLFSLALIQHAVFFYSFPPDPSKYVHVNIYAYVVTGLLLFGALKLQYWLAKRSEVVEEE